MKIAAIAVALVYLVSFVMADEPTLDVRQATPPGLRGDAVVDAKAYVLSTSDREQLIKMINDMLTSHPEADVNAANLMLEYLEQGKNTGAPSITARLATNKAVVSHAVNVLYSAAQGDRPAAVANTLGLISAAAPVVMAPLPKPVTTGNIPSRTFTMSSTSNRNIPLLPNTGSLIRSMTNAGIASFNAGPRFMPPKKSNDD
ncbi:hypothetical protein PHMEG_00038437 [Phytophthora megakarya]|uniref:RxLR effector protein n=1 Tax=Phytophthora megakarya TaxID=4795 RepID=A0A225UHF3_9STRA|nr:hypothetical protein PHMEG_00038437 [Phytophthora megakarya]